MQKEYQAPKISILMPVYNSQANLHLAIESILNQSFTDFELVIIDDGSSDRSSEIVQTFNDPRINFLSNSKNMGIVPTLNRGLDVANGQFIARMDADDISHPLRLETQLTLLERSNADICGCHFYTIDLGGSITGEITVPLHDDEFTACLANTVPFAHGSVLMRGSFIKKNNLRYGPNPYAEDFDLWIRFFECGGRFQNANAFLFQYRSYNESLSKIKGQQYASAARKLRRSFVLRNHIKCEEAVFSLMEHRFNLRYMDKVNIIFLAYLLWRQGGSFLNFLLSLRGPSLKITLHGLYRILRA